MSNFHLKKAYNLKKDEFYTRLEDIAHELQHYNHHFKDKVVYCNCDDPEWSNFYKYFNLNFDALRLKKLITTYYKADWCSYKLESAGIVIEKNQGNRNYQVVQFNQHKAQHNSWAFCFQVEIA